eukprot:gene19809-23693_t
MASLILAATNLGKITGAMPLLARKSMADENSPAWHNFQEKLERRKAISQRLQAFHKDVGTLRDLGKELREGSDQMASTIHRAAGKGVLLSARRRALRRRNSAVDSSMLSPSSGAEETYSSMLSPSSSVRYLAELYGEAQPEKTKMKAEGKSVFGSVLDSLGGFVSPSGSDEEREEVSDEDAQAQMGTATGPAGDLDAKSTSSSKDKSEKSEVGSSSDDASESQSSSSSSGSSSSEGEEEEGMQGLGINIPAAQIKHVFTALDHSRDGEVQTTDLMNIIFRGTGVVVKEDAVQQGAGFKSLAQGVANKMTKSNAEIAGKSLQSTDESPSKKSPGHQR